MLSGYQTKFCFLIEALSATSEITDALKLYGKQKLFMLTHFLDFMAFLPTPVVHLHIGDHLKPQDSISYTHDGSNHCKYEKRCNPRVIKWVMLTKLWGHVDKVIGLG